MDHMIDLKIAVLRITNKIPKSYKVGRAAEWPPNPRDMHGSFFPNGDDGRTERPAGHLGRIR